MLDKFISFIEKNSLFNKNDHILVAVSGGMDSVTLLDLFYKSGFKFSMAHCNFQLRGNESDNDEKFVEELAVKYKSELFSNRCDANLYAQEHRLSIQESARELRYEWFDKILKHNKIQKIAIAHNNDDKIETFFINLFRGAGLKGLKGIPVKRDNIVRPLLFAGRNDIEYYVKENRLQFREDSSNSSDKYLRNNIRNNVLPVLNKISKDFKFSATKSLHNLSDADHLLSEVICQKLSELITVEDNNAFSFKVLDLQALNPNKIWLYYILSKYGFIREITDKVSMALKYKGNVGQTFMSNDHELLMDRSKVIIRKRKKDNPKNNCQIVNDEAIIDEPIRIKFEVLENTPDFKFENNRNIAYFDKEKLLYPLAVRRWKKGDKMKPLGMTGKKLISDILIDNKVDLFSKASTYVILSDNEIIWLVGHRTSDKFKVTKNTSEILVASFIE